MGDGKREKDWGGDLCPNVMMMRACLYLLGPGLCYRYQKWVLLLPGLFTL